MRKLFGTDGIRGIANEFLSYELAKSVGIALARIVGKPHSAKIIIGTDTRISKDMLKSALCEGLSSEGADVYDVGVISTPAVAYLTVKTGADAGVMISASHNTYEYNGIKIFGHDGFKLSDADEEKIEHMIFSGAVTEGKALGKVIDAGYLKEEYISHLKSFISEDFSDISMVIDCANGSAKSTAKEVFTTPCSNVKFIGCDSDGYNINKGCGSTHLEYLINEVTESGADIGIAFDGDADRFLAVDSTGREIDGDYVMAILSLMLKEEGKLKKNTAVGTVMSNYGFSKFCEANGINFVGTKVGDRYVLEEIEKCGYSFGGEQSGHIIIREASTTGDGQLTAIYVLNAIKKYGKSLSELASVMKKYPQHMINVSADANGKTRFASDDGIKAVIKEAEERLGKSGRILVRPSGTEPLVRIMVESTDENETVTVCKTVADRIQKILNTTEK